MARGVLNWDGLVYLALVVESYGAWGMHRSPDTSCLTTGRSHVKQQVKDYFRSVPGSD